MNHPEAATSPRVTTIYVIYPRARGTIGIRGSHPPLSWERTTPPTRSDGDLYVFEVHVPDGETLDVKLVRGEEDWAHGRNYVIHAGDHLHLEPAFDRTSCELRDPVEIVDGDSRLTYQLLLPPSYGEQDNKRYPVIYAQDGQALWADSVDPFGVWRLDETLNGLYELAAIDEVIVVAINTSERRLERLSPVADPHYGGGDAHEHLRMIADVLKPGLDRELRTKPGPAETAVMGSSMGGLFSLYAVWNRPDVFGKAICLSSSFWWNNRWLIRSVQTAPSPRPVIYMDSGAALNPEEPKPSAHDGFHHTRAMHRALSRAGYTYPELHWLTFPGHSHGAAAWAARVTIPLQLLFPPPSVETS